MNKFKNAVNGLKIALNHKAVLIQIVLGALAIMGGLIIGLDYYEWLAFILCIFLVIGLEIFNTSIERIGDYLNINEDDRIKEIKDLASGAVLVISIMALIICIFVVARRLL